MNLRGRNKVDPSFNMSSMTDFVFLLLIFFILASTLVTTNALDMILPKSEAASNSQPALSINITQDLAYSVNDEATSPEFIESILRNKITDPENDVIILRAAEGVGIEKVVEVLDIAYRNKYKIVLATEQPK